MCCKKSNFIYGDYTYTYTLFFSLKKKKPFVISKVESGGVGSTDGGTAWTPSRLSEGYTTSVLKTQTGRLSLVLLSVN